jgi:translation initiation factor IF-3
MALVYCGGRGAPVAGAGELRARRFLRCSGGDREIERDFRVNERIRAREVRVIDENGAQLGIMPVREALRIAREHELDLIEVAPNAVPPVCRIMDYGKHRYQQAKRERETRKRQKSTEVRLLRMKPQIGTHDLEIKLRKLRELLGEGSKVRISVRFRGREVSRPELGTRLFDRIMQSLSDMAQPEGSPRLDGRMMSLLITPKPEVRAAPKKSRAPADVKEQVQEKSVEERPSQAEDAEDSGEAG